MFPIKSSLQGWKLCQNLCDVVVQQGQDPLPNVDLSIRYFGNQGLGGLCYRDTPGCPKDQPVETTVAVQPTTKIVTTAATSIVTTTKAEGATTTSAAKTSVLANVTSPKTLVSTLVTSLQPSSAVVSATASSSSTVTTVAVVSGSGITTTSVSPSTTAVPQIALTTEVVASSKANVQPATTASIKTGILYSGATALTFKSAVSVLTICLFF
ncbi:hypothetical protein BDR26DRAFT_948229 [Obelidium mucronatum]|nr:hypothetical protein BDR26DRAFT_948229 [Obelidium mucronatum]